MSNWYFINDSNKEVDIEKEGLDLTEEPRKAYVSVILTYEDIKELYNNIKEE